MTRLRSEAPPAQLEASWDTLLSFTEDAKINLVGNEIIHQTWGSEVVCLVGPQNIILVVTLE